MGNHDENYGKYGAMGSDEYKKLTRSLEVADDNRKHLEKEVHDLRILLKDLEDDLNESETEVTRLRSIQRNMIKSDSKRHDSSPDDSRTPVHKDLYDYKQLYIHRIDKKTTEDDLDKFFRRFGHVVNIRIIKHPFTKVPRGFAYVLFSHEHMAKAAMDHRPHWIGSGMVQTSYVKKQTKSYRTVPY